MGCSSLQHFSLTSLSKSYCGGHLHFDIVLCGELNCCCIAVIHIQLYTYTCRNIVNTIMMNEHTSLEKYTSHTLFEMVAKGLCVRGELETEQTATY